jgi:hypothetical protein
MIWCNVKHVINLPYLYWNKEKTKFLNVDLEMQDVNSFIYEVETLKDTKITKDNVSFHSI